MCFCFFIKVNFIIKDYSINTCWKRRLWLYIYFDGLLSYFIKTWETRIKATYKTFDAIETLAISVPSLARIIFYLCVCVRVCTKRVCLVYVFLWPVLCMQSVVINRQIRFDPISMLLLLEKKNIMGTKEHAPKSEEQVRFHEFNVYFEKYICK